MSQALIDINQLPGEVIEEFEFDDGALVDVQTTRLLSDYGLVQRFRADHSRELSAMLRLSSTPTIVLDGDLIDQVRAIIQRSDESLRLIDEFGTPELAASVEALQASVPSSDYQSMRMAAMAAVPGAQPLPDSIVVNDVGAVVTQQYAALADDVLGELRSEADSVVYDATRSLIFSVLIGLWVIVLTAPLLRFLYRAIKSPIERLTEQSRQIASVELPQGRLPRCVEETPTPLPRSKSSSPSRTTRSASWFTPSMRCTEPPSNLPQSKQVHDASSPTCSSTSVAGINASSTASSSG